MPANLKDLRNRIRSVRNTEQITAAMKLVSTAKFGRAQASVSAAKPYSRALQGMLEQAVARSGGRVSHPLLAEKEGKVVSLIVLSSERGLCGSYNSNVCKQTIKAVEQLKNAGFQVAITCVGRKAHQVLSRLYRRSGFEVVQYTLEEVTAEPGLLARPETVALITTPYDKQLRNFVEGFGKVLVSNFEEGRIARLSAVSTRFESAGSLPLAVTQILPLVPPSTSAAPVGEALFEPSLEGVFDLLIPRSFLTKVQQLFLEAVASEHCARMAAMESATRNAKEMLRKLQISYQRARQAAITRELIEIVSGAEAL